MCGRGGVKLTAGGGRLAGVDVADNDDVDMSLLLTAHCQPLLLCGDVKWCRHTPS